MNQQDDTDSLQIVPDPDKLDRYHRQQLSAMLDGELSPDQARFMLRRLQHDAELADCWERWQLCGDVLRGQRNALLPADFAHKVSAAIAADLHAPQASSRAGGPRLLRWGGGAALAASVAMAALLVGRQAGIEPEQAPLRALPELAASGDSAPAPRAPAAIDPVPEQPSPATDAAALLAGTALAAAEAPRRAAARRGRDQAQGAVATRSAESASRVAQALPAVAAADPAAVPAAVVEPDPMGPAPHSGPEAASTLLADLPPTRQGIGTDPFEALPMTVASRPWPRAAAGATAGYAVGLGNAMPAPTMWSGPPGPRGQGVAELFGLPAQATPRLPAATAIGVHAVRAGDASPAPAALHSGPR